MSQKYKLSKYWLQINLACYLAFIYPFTELKWNRWKINVESNWNIFTWIMSIYSSYANNVCESILFILVRLFKKYRMGI
jgi:hypothetical protein